MTADAPGPLLATGRDADVFDLGDGRVLRRYRPADGKVRDTTREAATMTHLAAHGYPVPLVHDAEGSDLVMDRIHGSTMLNRLTSRPWQLRRQARILAQLQRDLADIATDGLDLEGPRGAGAVIVHNDLHPENVMLADDGPVVIDWTGASFGPPGADTAVVWALLHAAEAPVSSVVDRLVATVGRRALLRAFLGASDVEAARLALPAVVERRQGDQNLSSSERARMTELLRSS